MRKSLKFPLPPERMYRNNFYRVPDEGLRIYCMFKTVVIFLRKRYLLVDSLKIIVNRI